MDSGYVFDDLGEAINEGDVVIMDGLAWMVAKIQLVEQAPNLDPTAKLPPTRVPPMIKVKIVTEVTLNQFLGGKLVKVYRSSKRLATEPKASSAP